MRILTDMTISFCFLLALTGTPAFAQDLTADEIAALFKRQIEVQNQPLTRSLNGQSARGLSLVTLDDIKAEKVSTESLAASSPQVGETPTLAPITDSLAGGSVVVNAETTAPAKPTAPSQPAGTEPAGTPQIATAPTDPNQPLVYARLDPEYQINLDIKFGYDSAALDTTQKTRLSTMCTAMQASPVELFRIIGHTDTSGTDEYNQRLSVLRAKEVARLLVQDCGIVATRLEIVGMGERFPIDEINPRAEENRRVEFQAMS